MRVPRERCRSRVFRKVSNVAALNVAHMARTNVPVRKLTAPKQATDLRVDAWSRTGSLISGGTHIRQRVPCCWKWHSSTLQSATPRRRARRCSVFTRRDLDRVGLGDLGAGLAQPESHMTKDSLALAHPQRHPVAQAQMRREQRVHRHRSFGRLRFGRAETASNIGPFYPNELRFEVQVTPLQSQDFGDT